MSNGTNDSHLAQNLGTQGLKKSVTEMGGYQQIMLAFINYITSVGATPHIPAHDKVPASVTNAANDAIDSLNSDFTAAQTTVGGLQKQVDGITDVVNATNAFARHSGITLKSILASIVQYKKDKESVNRSYLKDQINRMISNCQRLARSCSTAHTSTSSAVVTLQNSEKALNSALQKLQEAIPPANGKTLNLDKLTEQQAYNELQGQIGSLNSQISSLRSEISWLTFGEVAVGVVGGIIAVTNFWNPVGWVAAGLTTYGEVEMVGKKAHDVAEKNTDLENLALTQDEQAILHPIYSIKHAVSTLSDGVNAAEAIGKGLKSLQDNFNSAQTDLEGFLEDVTSNVSLEDLQSDVSYVQSDYSELEKLCNTLLSPLPTRVVSQSALANAKDAPSS
jgi:DNA repair exonuclease SbcCD ATPase subunit